MFEYQVFNIKVTQRANPSVVGFAPLKSLNQITQHSERNISLNLKFEFEKTRSH